MLQGLTGYTFSDTVEKYAHLTWVEALKLNLPGHERAFTSMMIAPPYRELIEGLSDKDAEKVREFGFGSFDLIESRDIERVIDRQSDSDQFTREQILDVVRRGSGMKYPWRHLRNRWYDSVCVVPGSSRWKDGMGAPTGKPLTLLDISYEGSVSRYFSDKNQGRTDYPSMRWQMAYAGFITVADLANVFFLPNRVKDRFYYAFRYSQDAWENLYDSLGDLTNLGEFLPWVVVGSHFTPTHSVEYRVRTIMDKLTVTEALTLLELSDWKSSDLASAVKSADYETVHQFIESGVKSPQYITQAFRAGVDVDNAATWYKAKVWNGKFVADAIREGLTPDEVAPWFRKGYRNAKMVRSFIENDVDIELASVLREGFVLLTR